MAEPVYDATAPAEEHVAGPGVLSECLDCGHAHHAHRGGLSCLAAIPVNTRSSAPPEYGAYTTGEGSVKFGSVCGCTRCRCERCEPPGAQATLAA